MEREGLHKHLDLSLEPAMLDSISSSLLRTIGAVSSLVGALKPTILCFHSVRPGPVGADGFVSSLSVSSGLIQSLVVRLRVLNVPVLSLADAVKRISAGDRSPFVVLTFDDGYVDNYTALFPVMLRYRAPFTIFLTSGLIDGVVPLWWDALERLEADRSARRKLRLTGEQDDSLASPNTLREHFRDASPHQQQKMLERLIANKNEAAEQWKSGVLDWSQIREMLNSGLLTVGAHSVHHPVLSRLGPETIRLELEQSRRRIEQETGTSVRFFAYPYGQDSEVGVEAPAIARALGFDAAFTTEGRPITGPDMNQMFALPRVLLSSKVEHADHALAYVSGQPASIKRWIGR